MAKRSFLVPVALAVAALASVSPTNAAATISPSATTIAQAQAVSQNAGMVLAHASDSTIRLAAHGSHSSHASHSSHESHSSHSSHSSSSY